MAWIVNHTYFTGEETSSAALNQLVETNEALKTKLSTLERRHGLVEAEVSMAWAVIDWANLEDDEPEAPADLDDDP